MQMVKENVTPEEMTREQNQLIAAGSSISFGDIYALETSHPIYRGKFYKADDIDDTFVVINGVLADVSEHAHRTNKALLGARSDYAEAKVQIESLEAQVQTLVQQNKEIKVQLDASMEHIGVQNHDIDVLVDEFENLSSEHEVTKVRLEELVEENTSLVGQLAHNNVDTQTMNENLSYYQNRVEALESANLSLTQELDDSLSEVKELRQLVNSLTNELSLVKYKMDIVQSLSKEHITELRNTKGDRNV